MTLKNLFWVTLDEGASPVTQLVKNLPAVGEGNGTPLQYSCLENPWTEEPGRLQSTGSLRVGHN